ncbi:hypothetical protein QYE76_019416 [Lolium multiflorum]|uniref:Uncharacterized protein n=1 Tax=Lolium multiflorum TaxID=4521 RepID=A0AAD8R5P6_LOLMU|nr:hypothetical protein QYE76_019416 [Lolium multiflorum]
MKRFIVELGVVPSALDPLVICDNMGAIANAQEPRSHKRLKHIKLRYHLIREYIKDGERLGMYKELGIADVEGTTAMEVFPRCQRVVMDRAVASLPAVCKQGIPVGSGGVCN